MLFGFGLNLTRNGIERSTLQVEINQPNIGDTPQISSRNDRICAI